MFVLFEHQTMVEVGTAPAFSPHVEQILEGIRSKDAAAVKAALIEVLERWQPASAPAERGSGGQV